MFWYKSWLDTRWRFLIGVAILALSACAVVLGYSRTVQLLALVPNVDVGGEIGRRIKESAELMRTYRGYVYAQWYGQNLVQTWTIFAVLLGSGGLVSSGSDGAALFTLSLPISRTAIVGARAAIGLGELFLLALIPSLLIPLLSCAVGPELQPERRARALGLHVHRRRGFFPPVRAMRASSRRRRTPPSTKRSKAPGTERFTWTAASGSC